MADYKIHRGNLHDVRKQIERHLVVIDQKASSGGAWATSGDNIYNTNSGNVGIGTANPTDKLEVVDGIRISKLGNPANTGSAQLAFTAPEDATSQWRAGLWVDYADSVINLWGGGAGLTFDNSAIIFDSGDPSPDQEKMRITPTGSVGIGTASPATPLHVYSATNPRIRAESGNSGLSAGFEMTNSVGTTVGYMTSTEAGTMVHTATGSLIFSPGSSEKVRIDTAGNVGIGTTSPVYPLNVFENAGNDYRASIACYGNATTSNSGAWARQDFFAPDGAGGYGTPGMIVRVTNSFGMRVDDDTGQIFLNAQGANGYISLQTAGSTRIRINSAGNVGIGTTSPGYELDVGGTGLKTGYRTINIGNQGSTTGDGSSLSLNVQGGAITLAATRSATLFEHYFTITGRSGEQLRIDHDGNVGIGTTSPSEPLTVQGNVRIEREAASDQHIYIFTNSSGHFFDGRGISANPKVNLYRTVEHRDGAGWTTGTTGHRFQLQDHGAANIRDVYYISKANPNIVTHQWFTHPSVERMRLTQDGNFGIGTTSPAGGLDVVGNYYGDGKLMFSTSDSWLRINQTPSVQFTSGVYYGSSTVRTDGFFQAGGTYTTVIHSNYIKWSAKDAYPASNLGYYGQVVQCIAGATITAGYAVALLSDTARTEVTHADADDQRPVLGVAVAAASAGAAVSVLVEGVIKLTGAQFTATAGQFCYASATAGYIQGTAPSTSGQWVKIVGWCSATDVMYVRPQWNWVQVA